MTLPEAIEYAEKVMSTTKLAQTGYRAELQTALSGLLKALKEGQA
jgi:hypothetical protein